MLSSFDLFCVVLSIFSPFVKAGKEYIIWRWSLVILIYQSSFLLYWWRKIFTPCVGSQLRLIQVEFASLASSHIHVKCFDQNGVKKENNKRSYKCLSHEHQIYVIFSNLRYIYGSHRSHYAHRQKEESTKLELQNSGDSLYVIIELEIHESHNSGPDW